LDPGYPRKKRHAAHISRLCHPHPVYSPGFPAVLAPVETSIKGPQIVGTCFYCLTIAVFRTACILAS
jgi:hypothetical protein